jgi:hypothetical protein
VTEPEDRDLAALDAYVRSQLAKAAETYAPHADLDARLAAALQAVEQEDGHLTVPGKLGGARHLAPEQRRNAAAQGLPHFQGHDSPDPPRAGRRQQSRRRARRCQLP